MLRALALAVGLLTTTLALSAEGRMMPFTGRLVDDLGQPIAGIVDLSVNFYRTEEAVDTINKVPFKFAQVALADGVFHISLNLSDADAEALLPLPTSAAFLQVEDSTHGRTYRKHPISRADLLSLEQPAPVPTGTQVSLPAANLAVPVAAAAAPAAPAAPLPPQAAPAVPAPVSILAASAGACLAATSVGAKFSVRSFDKLATCAASCTIAKSGSQCLRGWTLFADDQVFEFGNECVTVQIMPNLPALGRLCCCLAQSMPLPLFIDLPQNVRP